MKGRMIRLHGKKVRRRLHNRINWRDRFWVDKKNDVSKKIIVMG